jgi:hypothetical protein
MSAGESASADYIRLVCDRLVAAGSPNAEARKAIYAACRAIVAAKFTDGSRRESELERLEKAIRRQEMQAIYEETLNAK